LRGLELNLVQYQSSHSIGILATKPILVWMQKHGIEIDAGGRLTMGGARQQHPWRAKLDGGVRRAPPPRHRHGLPRLVALRPHAEGRGGGRRPLRRRGQMY